MVPPGGYCQHAIVKQCAKEVKVTYDSSMMISLIVHKAVGTNCVFTPSKQVLFFSYVKSDTAHVLVNAVDSNKSNIQ